LRPAPWYFAFLVLIVCGFTVQVILQIRKQTWESYRFGLYVLGSEIWEEVNTFLINNHLGEDGAIEWTAERLAAIHVEVAKEFTDETIDANLKEFGFLRMTSLYDDVTLYESPELRRGELEFKSWRENSWGYRPFAYERHGRTIRGIGYSSIRLDTHFFVGTVFDDISVEEMKDQEIELRKIASNVFTALKRRALELYMDVDHELYDLLETNNAWAFVYFIKADSVVWSSRNLTRNDLYLPRSIHDSNLYANIEHKNGSNYIQYSELFDKDPDNAFRIDLAIPCGYVQKSILLSGLYIGGSAALIILLVGIGGKSLRKRALKPMNSVITRVSEFSSKSIDKRIPVDGVDNDTARLISTFNHLLDRLEDGFKLQKSFIADTSHELRTPLSVLTFDLAQALKTVPADSAAAKHLKEAHREVGHMARIVNDLQWLAKNDAGQLYVEKKNIRLDEVLLETLSRCQKYAFKSDVQLLIDDMEIIEYYGDDKLLVHAYSNLVNNAIKYSPKGREVTLALLNRNSTIRLQVKDQGIGIPAKSLDKIFDRFYRVDVSRSRETGGSGLGLAITKQIAELHSGNIHVTSTIGKGSLFVLELPRMNGAHEG